MKVLIVEGGAMRGIFPAGILKAFSDNNYNDFDLFIGVSAGACNLASFITGNHDRNYNGYTKLMSQKRFISWRRFLTGSHLMDLDWLWKHLNNEYPIDELRIDKYYNKFYIVVTNINTGKPAYISPTSQNIHKVLLASSAMPIVYRGFIELDDKKYTDGGVSDPLPIDYAIQKGAKKILILRTRPANYTSSPEKIDKLWTWLLRKYPKLQMINSKHSDIYNKSLGLIENVPNDLIIEQICPDIEMRTGRTSQEIKGLEEDYRKGYDKGLEYLKKNDFKL